MQPPAPSSPRSTISRRDILRLTAVAGAGLAAAPLLAACGGDDGETTSSPSTTLGGSTTSSAPQSLGELKIGYLPITDATPLLVAHASGLLTKRGFEAPDPVLLRSWPSIAEAFQAKQVDVVHLLMPLAMQLRFGAKQPVKVVAWNHLNGSALTVAKDVQSVNDLAGTTVAIPFWWSIHNVVLQKILRAAGLTPIVSGSASAADKTVKLEVLAPADMPPALASGSIAGFIVADPFNALAETQDVGKILRFTGDVWRDHACCVTVVREDLVTERPDAAQALTDALAEAQLTAAADRAGTAKVLSEKGYLPQPLPAIERALTHYDLAEYQPTGAIVHADWKSERIDFQPFPFPSYTEELIEALRETTIDGDTSWLSAVDASAAHEELVAVGLAEKAIDNLGGNEKFGLTARTRTETIAP